MDPEASNTVTAMKAGFLKLFDAALIAAFAMASAVDRVRVVVDRIIMSIEMVRFFLSDSEKETEMMFSERRPRLFPVGFLPYVSLYGVLLFRLPQALSGCSRKRSLG